MKCLLTLTEEQREQISRRYKQEKNPRFREHLHCLLLKDRGHTHTEVAQMLLIGQDTITDGLNLSDLCQVTDKDRVHPKQSYLRLSGGIREDGAFTHQYHTQPFCDKCPTLSSHHRECIPTTADHEGELCDYLNCSAA